MKLGIFSRVALNRFQNFLNRPLWAAVFWFILIFLSGTTAFAQLSTLYVTGNQIATAASGGCTLRLKGVDIDGLEFSPYGYGPGGSSANCGGFTGNSTSGCGGDTLAAVTEAITAWHATVIRLPLNQDFWFGCTNPINSIPASTYQAAVSAIVGYCASENVYVIMDLHWSGTYNGTTPTTPCTGAGWGTATGQQEMADANAVTFWGSVASQPWTKNNPAVLFDLYNEPNALASWSVWFNGGGTGGIPAWTPGMQGLLNAVRSVGANNACLLGGMSFCDDLTGVISSPGPVTNTGNGVIYSAHLYGPNDGTTAASWNTAVPSSVLSAAPVFVGEFGGLTTCGTNPDNPTFDTNMIGSSGWAVTTTGVVGATAWSFTDDSCPNQLSNWTWTPNAWGAAVSTWLATPNPTCPPATATFTPNLTYTPTTTYTSTPTLSPTNTPNPCAQVYEAINCGGPQNIIGGVTWQADQAYTTGGFGYVTAGLANTVTNTIANSGAQQALYQSERYATPLEYKFTVPNGSYLVTLKNAELYWTAPGQRVFSVAINGTTVLSNFDIFAQVGEFTADDHSFVVNVTGGLIDIVATATVDNAQFAAIEITSE
ncbi:MAG TPA: cellulase family glycosylhydrolase, partial [bacterium]|nr:cellulase family glycosylhydrolase [bacterium]